MSCEGCNNGCCFCGGFYGCKGCDCIWFKGKSVLNCNCGCDIGGCDGKCGGCECGCGDGCGCSGDGCGGNGCVCCVGSGVRKKFVCGGCGVGVEKFVCGLMGVRVEFVCGGFGEVVNSGVVNCVCGVVVW